MSRKKVIQILGARPQFIKSAPIQRAFADLDVELLGLHTGQHYDAGMSDVFFEQLSLEKPSYTLGVGSGSHAEQTQRMMKGCADVFAKASPDLVLVYGDTNSTLAGALAASAMGIPLAHIEAGLRSHDLNMPEECNRIAVDHSSDLLFCPSDSAARNLRLEGWSAEKQLLVVGDVMYDNYLHYRSQPKADNLTIPKRPFFLCTVHRASNTQDESSFHELIEVLTLACRPYGELLLVEHPRWSSKGWGRKELTKSIPPQGYLEMLALLDNCQGVITDSGGLQKEAYFAKKPCLVLREESEWTELVEEGAVWLCGNDPARIQRAIEQMMEYQGNYPPYYGEGHAAKVIAEEILNFLGTC